MWWGRAGVKGLSAFRYCTAVLGLLDHFERGEQGRVLHEVAPTIARNSSAEHSTVFGFVFRGTEREVFLRVVRTISCCVEREMQLRAGALWGSGEDSSRTCES
jgi:hypothetical protein